MATEEHKRLAGIVKGTHALLRAECQRHGARIAWERHTARNDVLQEYATSMRRLSTECWADNNSSPRNGTCCRLEWIKAQCGEYFFNGGARRYDEKERDIRIKMTPNRSDVSSAERSRIAEDDRICIGDRSRDARRKISLLDVGSCYNPLGVESEFDVTAIDLIPTAGGVFKCDFLNVTIGERTILSSDAREIRQLSANSFDAVVFSLLLEYLPCPRQRYACCGNAYDVLKSGGILIIVSPDSKHVGANAGLMKSWRYALSKLGFMRIKYEKLRHVHCMVFRKCASRSVATRWADLQRFSENDRKYMSETEIFIPQDFRSGCSEGEGEIRRVDTRDDECDKYDLDMSSELPFGAALF